MNTPLEGKHEAQHKIESQQNQVVVFGKNRPVLLVEIVTHQQTRGNAGREALGKGKDQRVEANNHHISVAAVPSHQATHLHTNA